MDYDEMLDRAVTETPDTTGTSARFEVPDPDVRQEGHVSVVENFQSLCDRMDRAPDHVLQFLQTEVGTSGHIDESGRARLTGSFDAARIGTAIEAYVDVYVRCSECELPDTRLEREGDVTLLRCEACGARLATPN